MTLRLFLAVLIASAIPLSFAQAPEAPPPPPRPPAKVEQVAWMQGYWEGKGMGGTIEDLWGPARAGVMLGAFRLTRDDGKPGFYELFAIEEFEGSLRFVVKHFHPNWVGWEEKDKAVMLGLTRISENEAAFGGVIFRKAAPDVLEVGLTMRSKDGATTTQVLTFRKKPL